MSWRNDFTLQLIVVGSRTELRIRRYKSLNVQIDFMNIVLTIDHMQIGLTLSRLVTHQSVIEDLNHHHCPRAMIFCISEASASELKKIIRKCFLGITING